MTTPNQTTPLTPPYKLEIECPEASYYTVRIDDRWQDKLTWDEMLGLVAALTIPSPRACLQWLMTAEEHAARDKRFEPRAYPLAVSEPFEGAT